MAFSFKKLMNDVGEGVDSLASDAKGALDKQKVKDNINKKKRAISKEYTDLGEAFYTANSENNLDVNALLEYCDKVDALNEEIKELEAQLEAQPEKDTDKTTEETTEE
jgi:phosphatidate phosphatase PAH1